MGTIAASALIARASEVAQDQSNVTWTQPQALSWLNEGMLAICLAKPNAAVAILPKQLAPGTLQICDGREILDVIRNMGPDGATPGRAILPFDRRGKDEANPMWQSATPSTTVREWAWHEDAPRHYYVSPPVSAVSPVYIETMEAVDPTPLVLFTDIIPVDDIFQVALVDWVCYRFFSRDANVTPSVQRAQAHLQSFLAAVKGQQQGEQAASISTAEQQDATGAGS